MKTDIKKHENGGAKSWIKAHLSDIIPVLGLILVLVFFNAVSGGKVFTKTNFNTLFNEAFSLLIVTYALIFVMAQGKCYSNLNHTSAAHTTPPVTGVLPLCTRLRRVRRNNPPWRSL